MNTNETVAVTVAEKEVQGYNDLGDSTALGSVVSRVFEGEKVERHFFISALEKDKEGNPKEFSLGPTTNRFEFVDHQEALFPLIDQGFQIKRMEMMKGGLKLWTMLTPPDAFQTEDPIVWDKDIWGRNNDLLEEAIIVTSSIGPGQGIHYYFGWFRLVCTNGLMSEVLGLGHAKFSHLHWGSDKVSSFIEENRINDRINPRMGNTTGLNRTIDIIDNLEGDLIPLPIQKTVRPLAKLPKWYREDLRDQMILRFEDKSQGDEVTAFDVLNMVTNPLSMHTDEERKSEARQLFKLERTTIPLCQLIAFSSLGVQ